MLQFHLFEALNAFTDVISGVLANRLMSFLYWLMVVNTIMKSRILWLTFGPIFSIFLSGYLHLIINKAFWIFNPVLCCLSIINNVVVSSFLELFNISHVSFFQLDTAGKIELFALNAVTFKIFNRWDGLWTSVFRLLRAVINVLFYHTICILYPVFLSLLKCFIDLAHIDIMRRFILFKSF